MNSYTGRGNLVVSVFQPPNFHLVLIIFKCVLKYFDVRLNSLYYKTLISISYCIIQSNGITFQKENRKTILWIVYWCLIPTECTLYSCVYIRGIPLLHNIENIYLKNLLILKSLNMLLQHKHQWLAESSWTTSWFWTVLFLRTILNFRINNWMMYCKVTETLQLSLYFFQQSREWFI